MHTLVLFAAAGLFLLCCRPAGGIANPRCASEPPKGFRVAVGFYGLSRSLDRTLPSIERHVFDVLDRKGISFDVFWSGLDAAHVTNARSHENHLALDSSDFTKIRPCVFSVVSQSAVSHGEFSAFIKAREGQIITDYWHDNFASTKNLLVAYHSMHNLNALVHKYASAGNFTYDAVLILRPDTAVMTDIDIADHLPEIIEENEKFRALDQPGNYSQPIWIPDFQPWDGVNDRAAFGSPHVISLYLNRGRMFRDAVGIGGKLYGEVFLKAYLELHNLKFRPSSLRVVRVRADGTIAPLDLVQSNMNVTDEVFASMQQCFVKVDGIVRYSSQLC